MRLAVVVLALAAGLFMAWRMRHPSRAPLPPKPPVSSPAPAPAETPTSTRPPVQVRTQLDPADPELREAAERLGAAVEPAIDSIAVPTVDAAMEEYARRRDLQELQSRLERVIATHPEQATRLHGHFMAAKDPELLFVLAKLAAGRLQGEGFAPWIETADSGTGDQRRFAMYALEGDGRGCASDVLVAAWRGPSAGTARPTAGFVLEGRIEGFDASVRESIHVVCREELRRSKDAELRAEAVALLATPQLAETDRGDVVGLLLHDPEEGVRLAALQALATSGAVTDPAVKAVLDQIIADATTPQRLLRAAKEVRQASELR